MISPQFAAQSWSSVTAIYGHLSLYYFVVCMDPPIVLLLDKQPKDLGSHIATHMSHIYL